MHRRCLHRLIRRLPRGAWIGGAGLLIWDAAEVPYYHTPQDTVDTLQPARLRQAGIVASHAALALIRDAEGAMVMTMPQEAVA